MSVTKRDNKILLTGSSEGFDVEPGPFKVTYRITEAILIFCCQVPPLSTLLGRPDSPMELGHSLL